MIFPRSHWFRLGLAFFGLLLASSPFAAARASLCAQVSSPEHLGRLGEDVRLEDLLSDLLPVGLRDKRPPHHHHGNPEIELSVWTEHGDSWLEISSDLREGVQAATVKMYRTLFSTVSVHQMGNIVRIWQTIPDINSTDPGRLERYREFNIGRRAAWQDGPMTGYPAATAIGDHSGRDGRLKLVAFVSKRVTRALENPRQTPAFRYGEAYGPSAPLFLRGMILFDLYHPELFISGTASVREQQTVFAGDVEGQTREALKNIEALIHQPAVAQEGFDNTSGLRDLTYVHVYVRHLQDLEKVRGIVEEYLPAERVKYVIADICRSDLRVEIEAVLPLKRKTP